MIDDPDPMPEAEPDPYFDEEAAFRLRLLLVKQLLAFVEARDPVAPLDGEHDHRCVRGPWSPAVRKAEDDALAACYRAIASMANGLVDETPPEAE